MTVMLSSQGIGLITVIAVSGCSVMLMVLGRQKLLEARKEEDSEEECPGDLEGGHRSVSSADSLKTFSVLQQSLSSTNRCKDGEDSIALRINLDVAAKLTKPKSACKNLAKISSQDKKNKLVKKVRFSEDVVEPSGDNAEYRRRHALALAARAAQPRSQREKAETINSTPRMTEGSAKRNPVKGECRMQTIAKPHMPANRKALYNGIFHDRSQRALLY